MNIERKKIKLERLEKKLAKKSLIDFIPIPDFPSNRYLLYFLISKIRKKKLEEKIEKLKKL